MNRFANLAFRIGLAGVFLYFGIDKFFNADSWIHFVPDWFPVKSVEFMYVLGFIESLLGLLILLGLFTSIAASFAALLLVPVMFSLGFNEIMMRDFAIFMLAVGLFFMGSGEFSLDNWRKNK